MYLYIYSCIYSYIHILIKAYTIDIKTIIHKKNGILDLITRYPFTFLSPPPGVWCAFSNEPTFDSVFQSNLRVSIWRAKPQIENRLEKSQCVYYCLSVKNDFRGFRMFIYFRCRICQEYYYSLSRRILFYVQTIWRGISKIAIRSKQTKYDYEIIFQAFFEESNCFHYSNHKKKTDTAPLPFSCLLRPHATRFPTNQLYSHLSSLTFVSLSLF